MESSGVSARWLSFPNASGASPHCVILSYLFIIFENFCPNQRVKPDHNSCAGKSNDLNVIHARTHNTHKDRQSEAWPLHYPKSKANVNKAIATPLSRSSVDTFCVLTDRPTSMLMVITQCSLWVACGTRFRLAELTLFPNIIGNTTWARTLLG